MQTPTLSGMLGRYEYQDERSDKFWSIKYVPSNGMYLAEWGRNGRDPQDSKEYTGDEALKKIREKVAKGYRLVQKYDTEAAQARDRVEKKRSQRREDTLLGVNFMEELRNLKSEDDEDAA